MNKRIRFIDFIKRNYEQEYTRFGDVKYYMIYDLPDIIFMDAPLSLLEDENGIELESFQTFKEYYLKRYGYKYETKVMNIEIDGKSVKYLLLFASKPLLPMYSEFLIPDIGFFKNLKLKSRKYDYVISACRKLIKKEINNYDPPSNYFLCMDDKWNYFDNIFDED